VNLKPRFLLSLVFLTLALSACASSSFTILTPTSNSTQISPVNTDVFWDAALQVDSLKIILDPKGTASDVTSQFLVSSTAPASHATAHLNLSQGTHTLEVSGNLWNSAHKAYIAQSSSATFLSSTSAGRAVTYTMTVFAWEPGFPAGTLGDVSFGGTFPGGGAVPPSPNRNVNLIFTFEGNTNDVVPYSVKADHKGVNDGKGFEIITGEASVTVQDAKTYATIAHGTFLPEARIFVSVDNGNGGIGFGSGGALPVVDSDFPAGIAVAYPYAQFRAPVTDLESNYTATAIWGISCFGFGHNSPPNIGCPTPALATTAGNLIVTSNVGQDVSPKGVPFAIFTTVVH
jgi:hypothetical protein